MTIFDLHGLQRSPGSAPSTWTGPVGDGPPHVDAGEVGRARLGRDLTVDAVDRFHLDGRARGDAHRRRDVGMPAIVALVGLASERQRRIDMDVTVRHVAWGRVGAAAPDPVQRT